jgi:hypothetical protein
MKVEFSKQSNLDFIRGEIETVNKKIIHAKIMGDKTLTQKLQQRRDELIAKREELKAG